MKIKIDNNNFVIGVISKGNANGFIEIACDIPQDFIKEYKSYKYENFKLVFNQAKKDMVVFQDDLKVELDEINQWLNTNYLSILKAMRNNDEAFLLEYDAKEARKEEIENILKG